MEGLPQKLLNYCLSFISPGFEQNGCGIYYPGNLMYFNSNKRFELFSSFIFPGIRTQCVSNKSVNYFLHLFSCFFFKRFIDFIKDCLIFFMIFKVANVGIRNMGKFHQLYVSRLLQGCQGKKIRFQK